MQLADSIPLRGMRTEIGLRRNGARLTHGREPRTVTGYGLIRRIKAIYQRPRDLCAAAMLGEAKEGPGPLAKTLDQTSLGQEFKVTRDPGLRLPQDVGQIGNREFGLCQQG